MTANNSKYYLFYLKKIVDQYTENWSRELLVIDSVLETNAWI